MLRFIKHHIATEDGVQFYGLLSLMIFVLFFLVVTIRMIRMRKSMVDELSAIPFNDDEPATNNTDYENN